MNISQISLSRLRVIALFSYFCWLLLSPAHAQIKIEIAGASGGSTVQLTFSGSYETTSAELNDDDLYNGQSGRDFVNTNLGGFVSSSTVACSGLVSPIGALQEFTVVNSGADDIFTLDFTNGVDSTPGATIECSGSATLNASIDDFNQGIFDLNIDPTDHDGSFQLEICTPTCTSFSGSTTAQTTQRTIVNYMSRRADQITANEPDLVSRARNGYGGIGDQAVSFIAQGDLENTQIAFSTSLRQVMNARERTKVERRADLGSLMALGAQPLAKPMVTAGFDVWAQGRLAQIEHEASESDLGLLYFGADYKFASGLLVGILAQLDWTDEKDATNNNKIDGHGFLVGPYVVGRVHQNVLFDGRIAWGTSDNGISPIGTYEDSFETSRWLIKAQLTGDIRYGSLNLAPHVGVIYFEEDQDSYTDSLNTFIPEQTIKLGRLTLGPKFSTSIQNGSGTLSPYVVLKGIWDFEREDIINVTTGFAEGTDDFRGRVEGGLTMTGSDGITLTGEGFYDGIGASGFDAYGGSAELSVKLN